MARNSAKARAEEWLHITQRSVAGAFPVHCSVLLYIFIGKEVIEMPHQHGGKPGSSGKGASGGGTNDKGSRNSEIAKESSSKDSKDSSSKK